MKYKIGDVSKILGISPDLLRYYQKKGVVSPTMGENNNYRYYDAWDINFLLDCLWFKSFGFGIEQTAKLVSDSTYENVLHDMREKHAEIEASLRREQMLLTRAGQYFDEIARTKTMLGKCDLVYSPEIYLYLNRYNHDYENIAGLQHISQRWLKYMPFMHRSFEIDRQDLENRTENYAWGFSITMDFVEKLGVPLEPPVVHYPSEPSVHAIFRSSGKTGFSPKHLAFVMDFVRQNGLTVAGSARGNLVCSVMEEGRLTGYFEVWLPVKPKDGLTFAPAVKDAEEASHA